MRQKALLGQGHRQAWPLSAVAPSPPASPSTMSGRVGDLSPTQAETLAKVRAPFPAAPKERAEGRRGWQRQQPCPTLLFHSVRDIVSLLSPLPRSALTVTSGLSREAIEGMTPLPVNSVGARSSLTSHSGVRPKSFFWQLPSCPSPRTLW